MKIMHTPVRALAPLALVAGAIAPVSTGQEWDVDPPPGPIGGVGVCRIYAADAGPGGTITLTGPGTYVVETPLTVPNGAPLFDIQGDHVWLDGQGHPITTQEGSGPVVASSLPSDPDWWMIADLSIVGGSNETTPAIDMPESKNTQIVDVWITDWGHSKVINVGDAAGLSRTHVTNTPGTVICAGNDALLQENSARGIGAFAQVGDRSVSRANHVVNTTGTVMSAGDSFRDCDSKYAEFGQGYNVGCGVFLKSLDVCDAQDPAPTAPVIVAGAGATLESVRVAVESSLVQSGSVLEVVQIGVSSPDQNKPATISETEITWLQTTTSTVPSMLASRVPTTLVNSTISTDAGSTAEVTHDPQVFMLEGAPVRLHRSTIRSAGRGGAIAGSEVSATGSTFQTEQTGFQAVVDTVAGTFNDCAVRAGRRFGPAGALPAPVNTQVAFRGSTVTLTDCDISGRETDGVALDLLGGSSVSGCTIEGRVDLRGIATSFARNSVVMPGNVGMNLFDSAHALDGNIFRVLSFAIFADFIIANGGGHTITNNTFNGGMNTTCIDLGAATGVEVTGNSASFAGGAGQFVVPGPNTHVISTIYTDTLPPGSDHKPNVVTTY